MRVLVVLMGVVGCVAESPNASDPLAFAPPNPFMTVTGAPQIGCQPNTGLQFFPPNPTPQPVSAPDVLNPRHIASVPVFKIQQHEVTRGEFAACVAAGMCSPARDFGGPVDDLLPQTGVNWDQAAKHCMFIGARLPSEEEWEYAASNPDDREYPTGNTMPTCDEANRFGCDNKIRAVMTGATATPDGVFDMSGNVAEWTNDWWMVPGDVVASKAYKSIRGGSFLDGPTKQCKRAVGSDTFARLPVAQHVDIGFRCVK